MTTMPTSDPALRSASPAAATPLERLESDLAAARAEVHELRRRLEEAQACRLAEARELGEVKRQRDGLQFRTDYLEEKLDQLRRPAPSARPWWARLRL